MRHPWATLRSRGTGNGTRASLLPLRAGADGRRRGAAGVVRIPRRIPLCQSRSSYADRPSDKGAGGPHTASLGRERQAPERAPRLLRPPIGACRHVRRSCLAG
jgi:hypothetical protein